MNSFIPIFGTTTVQLTFTSTTKEKVKRGNHNERLIDYMDDFDDVTISSIE